MQGWLERERGGGTGGQDDLEEIDVVQGELSGRVLAQLVQVVREHEIELTNVHLLNLFLFLNE